jgi:hypothetical protein
VDVRDAEERIAGDRRRGGRLRSDGHRVTKLIVAREAYHCHYDDLPPRQKRRVLELIALAKLENEIAKSSAGA